MSAEPRILMTGASGQLGRYFLAAFAGKSAFVPAGRRAAPSGGVAFDLEDPKQTQDAIVFTRPDIVIHAASLTNVDGCEKDRKAAWRSNVLATGNLVEAMKKAVPSARLVYISTDQVYPGPGPSTEDDALPQTVYAMTKMWGEDVALSFGNALAVRINFVGEGTPSRPGFVDGLIAKLREKSSVTLFEDALFNPLYAGDLPQLLVALARRDERGVVNLGSSGEGLSKAAFMRGLAERLSLSLDNAKSGKLADGGLMAQRPLDTRMDVRRAERILATRLPDAGAVMDRMAADISRRRDKAA
jgi:dTDP-4-dehydrorhamnose reductase